MSLQKGYVQNTVDTNAAMQQLEIFIESFPEKLKQFSNEELLKRPAPDKWKKSKNNVVRRWRK